MEGGMERGRGGWREGWRDGRPREHVGKSTLCPSVVFLAWDRVNLAHRICNEPLLFVTDIAPRPPCCLHLFSRNECRGNGENSGGDQVALWGETEKKSFWSFLKLNPFDSRVQKLKRLEIPAFFGAGRFHAFEAGAAGSL